MRNLATAADAGDVPWAGEAAATKRPVKSVAHPVFRRYGFAHEHAFDQDHLVVGLLTAACSNACA
jgi:hypothetical protein